MWCHCGDAGHYGGTVVTVVVLWQFCVHCGSTVSLVTAVLSQYYMFWWYCGHSDSTVVIAVPMG